MAQEVWTLDRESLKKLQRDHQRLSRQVEDLRKLIQQTAHGDKAAEHYLIRPVSNIAPQGYGDCHLGRMSATGTAEVFGPTKTVFNHGLVALVAGEWTVGHRERGGGKLVPCSPTRGGWLQIRNDSSQDLDRYQILGITGVVDTPAADLPAFLNAAVFTGDIPQVCDHVGKFVVVQQPIKSGEIGPCLVSGATQVKIDVSASDPDRDYVEIIHDEHQHLQARYHGSGRILWREGGSGGVEWAIVRYGEHRMSVWKATLTEDMGATNPNEASADLVQLDGTATSETITAHDDDGIFAALTSGATVYVVEFLCGHYTIQAECP